MNKINMKINNIINETRIEILTKQPQKKLSLKQAKKLKEVTLAEKAEDKKPKKTIKRKINVLKP